MSRAEGQRGTAAEGTGKPTPVRMSCVVWRSAHGESGGAGPHGKVQGVELGVRSAGGVVGRRRSGLAASEAVVREWDPGVQLEPAG